MLPRQISDNTMGHLRGKSGDADKKESELEPGEVWQRVLRILAWKPSMEHHKFPDHSATSIQRWLEVGVRKRPDIDFRIECCFCVFLPSWPQLLVLLVLPFGRVCVGGKFAEFKNDEGEVL